MSDSYETEEAEVLASVVALMLDDLKAKGVTWTEVAFPPPPRDGFVPRPRMQKAAASGDRRIEHRYQSESNLYTDREIRSAYERVTDDHRSVPGWEVVGWWDDSEKPGTISSPPPPDGTVTLAIDIGRARVTFSPDGKTRGYFVGVDAWLTGATKLHMREDPTISEDAYGVAGVFFGCMIKVNGQWVPDPTWTGDMRC